ncbi:MAG TPA: hypothetical protein VN636_20495 [Acidimicrobiia bacterium]|nr:hypothetical protein [Acidimicrobiia bacterium]
MAENETSGMILLDVAAGDGHFDQDLLERFGHVVRVCHGPDHATLCPLLAGTGCDAFEQAHGVIFELDLDRHQHRAILRRYRDLARPDVPIRAIVSAEQARRYASMLDGIEVLTHEATVADLDGFASEVEAADRTAP